MDAGKLPWLALSFAWVVSGRLLWAIYYKGIDTARHETWFCQGTGNQGTCGKLILNSLTWAMNSQENVRVVLNQLFHLVSRQECSQHFRKACIKKKKKNQGQQSMKNPQYWQMVFLTPGKHLFYEGIICSCVSPRGLWKFGRFPLLTESAL